MARDYGVTLTREQADIVVAAFRAASPLICGWNGIWNTLQQGMTRAAAKKEDYHVELPSGRILRYMRPSQLGGLSAETVSGRGIVRKKWWGGSLTENLTQATAREVFASFIPIIEYELGLPVLFHVHDELTCLVQEDKAEDALRDLLTVMRTPPSFMPDLPLDAEGKIVATYPNK